jgi:hypothetical protein
MEAFDRSEIQQLERNLDLIADGEEDAGVVSNVARRVIAQRS